MRTFLGAIAIGMFVLWTSAGNAQVTPLGTNPMGTPQTMSGPPQSYSQYYTNQLKSYHRPQASARNYTIDRMYYHNENLSPYLNLGRVRTDPGALNNYYRYVRPELQRRQNTPPPNQTVSRPTAPSPTMPVAQPNHGPVAPMNSYYNRFYTPPKPTTGLLPKMP